MTKFLRNRRFFWGVASLWVFLYPLVAGHAQMDQAPEVPEKGPIEVSRGEIQKRQSTAKNAQDLLTQAQNDWQSGRISDAIEKLSTALRSLPALPATANLRETIFQRYQEAVLQQSDRLIQDAHYKEAETMLALFMEDARDAQVAASSISPAVRRQIGRVKSDDYYNKALTPEHLERVSAVDALLVTAEGARQIADYNQAVDRYHQVLNLDPTNKAARQGLERVEKEMTNYYQIARNEARAAQIQNIAREWETPVPITGATIEELRQTQDLGGTSEGTMAARLEEKLNRIEIPVIEFTDARLGDVTAFLTQKSQELDNVERDPLKKGISIVIFGSSDPADDPANRPLSLSLKNIPLGEVLRYAADKTGMRMRVDDYVVALVPASQPGEDANLIVRTFVVPPGFLTAGGAAAPSGPVDPFAPVDAGGAGAGSPLTRISMQDYLEQNGVNFPGGSFAKYMPSSSTLIIRNTPGNVRTVENLVFAARQGGAKAIKINFTVFDINDQALKEWNNDVLLGAFDVPGSGENVFASGGTVGSGANPPDGEFPFRFPGSGIPVGSTPVTGGLRSGDPRGRITIDDVLERDSPEITIDNAPGTFGIAGVFTDPQFQWVLRSLNQRKGFDHVHRTGVIVNPGQRAVIQQVREFIYPTEYDPPEIPNDTSPDSIIIVYDFAGNIIDVIGDEGGFAATPANPTAFETRGLGNILEVEPQLGPDNTTVDLLVTSDLSEFVGFINYGSPINFGVTTPSGGVNLTEATPNRILMPVFEAVKDNTNVSVYDGSTIAIGGYLGDQIDMVEDKVPLLGDLPAVGRMFRSKIKQQTRRAILMFVSVRVIDPAGAPVNEVQSLDDTPGSATVSAR